MKQECLIKEKTKSKSYSKLNKWFKQANRSSEEHSWIENLITSTAANHESLQSLLRDATTAEIPAATSPGVPTSEETSV